MSDRELLVSRNPNARVASMLIATFGCLWKGEEGRRLMLLSFAHVLVLVLVLAHVHE